MKTTCTLRMTKKEGSLCRDRGGAGPRGRWPLEAHVRCWGGRVTISPDGHRDSTVPVLLAWKSGGHSPGPTPAPTVTVWFGRRVTRSLGHDPGCNNCSRGPSRAASEEPPEAPARPSDCEGFCDNTSHIRAPPSLHPHPVGGGLVTESGGGEAANGLPGRGHLLGRPRLDGEASRCPVFGCSAVIQNWGS